MSIFDEILAARGLTEVETRAAFLKPDYDLGKHDPFLLPDMDKAVERLVAAKANGDKITIYGDYDIDGLTATTLLLEAFSRFGFAEVSSFIPNRFVEGYGMTIDAVEKIAADGTKLIVTVDCGSLSEKEIIRAGELGVDVIVTDHHNVAPIQPPAVAVVNPKRLLQDYPDEYDGFALKKTSGNSAKNSTSKLYPFVDLPGVGVAFKLVQALQTRLDGFESGQEKWLLDLVALGTVCDVVTLTNENRLHVYWGLHVLSKTRRPGLKALLAVAKVDPLHVNARSLGFGLGPRMNASGRLETAKLSLDLLLASDGMQALQYAQELDDLNLRRRIEQDKIFQQATIQAENYSDDPVLVLSGSGWNHGIVGIVAAKILEKYKKPTFVIEELEDEIDSKKISKGSARSYGDFSAVDSIRSADDLIIKGGGHKLAAGVTLFTENIDAFRKRLNEFYQKQALNLIEQQSKLLPQADVEARLSDIDDELVASITTLEPFGSGNPQPILNSRKLRVENVRKMGAASQHLKLTVSDGEQRMDMIAFGAPEYFFVEPGQIIDVWYEPIINEWQGRRSVEGRLIHLELRADL